MSSEDGSIIAASMAALFFGIQLVLYCVLVYHLPKHDSRRGRIGFTAIATALTGISLANLTLTMLYAERATALHSPDFTGEGPAGIDRTIKVLARISLLIAQLIVVWRTWILWTTSIAVRAILAFLSFASCATTIVSIGLCAVAGLGTADIPSPALVMLVPLVVTNIIGLAVTMMRLRSASQGRILWTPARSLRWARRIAFAIDSGAILGIFLILYLAAEIAGADAHYGDGAEDHALARVLNGAASGIAGVYAIITILLVVRHGSTADHLIGKDSLGSTRDDHTLTSSTAWEKEGKKWSGKEDNWDQSDIALSDRATISSVDELPRYSRHMRDVRAFPALQTGALQLPPSHPTRPLHVEKARTRGIEPAGERSGAPATASPHAERDIVEVPTASEHVLFAGMQADRALNLRSFALPPLGARTHTPRTAPAARSYPTPALALLNARDEDAHHEQADASRTIGATSYARATGAPYRTRSPPATSRPSIAPRRATHGYSTSSIASPLQSIRELPPAPPPESDDASACVHAPSYARAPSDDGSHHTGDAHAWEGAPSPSSSLETIADPPTAWRWPGPNPSGLSSRRAPSYPYSWSRTPISHYAAPCHPAKTYQSPPRPYENRTSQPAPSDPATSPRPALSNHTTSYKTHQPTPHRHTLPGRSAISHLPNPSVISHLSSPSTYS
ncbi:hypothetical protein HDZ31DRAFT_69247, partial [Schizophyllum fasciatum]